MSPERTYGTAGRNGDPPFNQGKSQHRQGRLQQLEEARHELWQ